MYLRCFPRPERPQIASPPEASLRPEPGVASGPRGARQVDGFNRVMEAAAEKKFQVTGQRPSRTRARARGREGGSPAEVQMAGVLDCEVSGLATCWECRCFGVVVV